jgi:hypothetical protein
MDLIEAPRRMMASYFTLRLACGLLEAYDPVIACLFHRGAREAQPVPISSQPGV